MSDEVELLTIGTMLKKLQHTTGLEHLNIFNIRYAINKLGIVPVARAGNLPVFSDEQFLSIQNELAATAARRIQRAVVADLSRFNRPTKVF